MYTKWINDKNNSCSIFLKFVFQMETPKKTNMITKEATKIVVLILIWQEVLCSEVVEMSVRWPFGWDQGHCWLSHKAVLRSPELCFLRLFQNEMHVFRLCYVHTEGSADISIKTDVSIWAGFQPFCNFHLYMHMSDYVYIFLPKHTHFIAFIYLCYSEK